MPTERDPHDSDPIIDSDGASESQGGDGTPEQSAASAYEVGFRRPPKKTQFKPGESGNKRGRPKGNKNFKTDFLEEFQERIVIREGDRSKKVTKQRAYVKKIYNDSMKGNTRSASLVMSAIGRYLDPGAQELETPDKLTDDDQAILGDFAERLKRQLEAERESKTETEEMLPKEPK